MNSPLPNEELLERQQLVFALIIFCVGLTLGISAFRLIINIESSLYSVLSILRAVAGIAVLLFLFFFLWSTVSLWQRRVCVKLLEGFVQQANLKAMSISWSLTFVVLSLLTEFIDAGLILPTVFYTKISTAVLLLTFSISFFLLTRVPNEDY